MARRVRTLLAACAAVAVMAGCIPDDPDPVAVPAPTSGGESNDTVSPVALAPRGGFGTSRLAFFADCPDLLGYLQAEALEQVTAWGFGGGPWWGPVPAMMAETAGAAPATTAAPDLAMPATGGVDYSATNTQEVGVDEGDVVETNGTHVFVAGADGVRIVSVTDAEVVTTLSVPLGSHQLLLDGRRLVVATQPANQWSETVVSLFDVADPSAPVLVERHHLEGSLTASRAAAGIARIVLSSPLAPRLTFVTPNQFGLDEARALAENQRIIRGSTIDDWMPRSFRESADGEYGDIVTALECTSVAAPRDFAGLGITWIASVDLGRGDGGALRASAGVVSDGGTVYATADRLYLATTSWKQQPSPLGSPVAAGVTTTLIHRFALGGDGNARYEASGEVSGRLLNQFAMSDLDGDLRVATTVDSWDGNRPSESFVHVLRPRGDTLVTVGSVGGLGLTEQIYAVRFLGSQAYVVTFRQTDPLYVVDLADPTAPRVAGELKIPGYSAYLHPVGDGLLLGVGQDATDDGRTLGTQLSLFDVSDPSAPVRLSTLAIGGSSEAEWDHKAFLYWPADGTIVIPVSPWWGPCPVDTACLAGKVTSPQGGVVVAQLQGESLVARGTIQHASTSFDPCWNPMQRSMVIGDEIATVGLDQVQFTDRATLAVRAAARWGQPEQYGCGWID